MPLCLADGSLAGAVTTRDIVAKVVAKGLDPREVRLADLADPGDALSLDVDAPVAEAVSLMTSTRCARLPVTEGTPRHRSGDSSATPRRRWPSRPSWSDAWADD